MNICYGHPNKHEPIVIEDKYNCPLCNAMHKIQELEDIINHPIALLLGDDERDVILKTDRGQAKIATVIGPGRIYYKRD